MIWQANRYIYMSKGTTIKLSDIRPNFPAPVPTAHRCPICDSEMKKGGNRTMCSKNGRAGDGFRWHNYHFDDPATYGFGGYNWVLYPLYYEQNRTELEAIRCMDLPDPEIEHVEYSAYFYKLPRQRNTGSRARRLLHRVRLTKSWGYWRWKEYPPASFDFPTIDTDLSGFDPKHPRWLFERIDAMVAYQ